MRLFRAPWVLPIHDAPIPDGAIAVAGDLIEAVGPFAEIRDAFPTAPLAALERTILLPGLVNAHTHLGLTGLADPPRGRGLLAWLEGLVEATRDLPDEAFLEAARRGVARSLRLGTALIGDIVTRPAVAAAYREHPAMQARLFFELIGVDLESGRRALEAIRERIAAFPPVPGIRPGISPHAPYSVHPRLWTEAVGLARSLRVPWTAHVAEDEPEREFLTRGTGPLAEFLRRMGATPFPPPGRTAARWLREEDLLDETALLVHGVGLDEDEARGLALEDAGLCLCPRSNAALGLPPPPVEMLYHAGVFLSLGTDSLASNRDLGLWGEMRAVRRLAPTVPASAILAMATAHGAMALGFTGRAGSLHPGAPARILAVAAPDLGGGDPAAYLVETPVEDRVRWLTTAPGIPDPLEEEPRFW